MKTIWVSLGERSYDIIIGKGILKTRVSHLQKLNIGKDALIVTNKTIKSLYGNILRDYLSRGSFNTAFELIPDSERAKSFSILRGLIRRIASYDKNKSVFIVALGGGVIGDLAGFAAAIYKRGIPYIQIPTTLLAQVDSAIGGKVAIDLPEAKNLVGAFYQPRIVLSDIGFKDTLSPRQVRNGLAEIIKYGIISDPFLFEYLERNHEKIMGLDDDAFKFVVERSSIIKAEFVSRDEYDNLGLRAKLNYGHTVGHAIETASGYSKRYYHGEAISVGMVVSASMAVRLGLFKRKDLFRVKALIKRCGLPIALKGLDIAKIYSAHLHDKKFVSEKNRFILPTRIGAVKVVEGINERVIKAAIRENTIF